MLHLFLNRDLGSHRLREFSQDGFAETLPQAVNSDPHGGLAHAELESGLGLWLVGTACKPRLQRLKLFHFPIRHTVRLDPRQGSSQDRVCPMAIKGFVRWHGLVIGDLDAGQA